MSYWSRPSFSANGKALYFVLQDHSSGGGPELWRTNVESGQSEAVFPGIAMRSFAVSPDDQRALYTTAAAGEQPQLWIAPMDKSSPPKRIGVPGDCYPYFGPHGKVLFQFTEGKVNYLGQMNQDGSGRSKALQYPVDALAGVSPGRRWIMAGATLANGEEAPVAIPADGGLPRRICATSCDPVWSLDGRFLFVPVQVPSSTSPGRSLVIPTGPDEDLSALPPGGIKALAEASDVPGSLSINQADFVPGRDLAHFAYVKTAMHYNLFRVQVP